MTIRELIRLLESHPSGLRVVVDGYDNLSPEQFRMVKISLNTGTREYVGAHDDVDYVPEEKPAGLEVDEALALHRTSH